MVFPLLHNPLPATPSHRLLVAYLRAFNDRGGAGLPAFLRGNFALPKARPGLLEEIAKGQAGQRRQTGGLDLRNIVSLKAGSAVALVQSRRLGTWSRLSVYLAAAPPDFEKPTLPYRIVGLGMADAPTPEGSLPPQPLSDAEIARRMNRLMRLVASDGFSGTVLVARQGRPLYAHAYGLANRTYGVPNTPATRYNLASITKMFTAVAVAQLVDAGRLGFDDPVGKLLPDYPNVEVARRVTVRQLLTHTSGLIGAREMAEGHPTPVWAHTVDDHARPFLAEPLAFPPGERFGYSNAGYILLGKIVERASGQGYYDYLRDHVFRPAGMAHAAFPEMDLPTRDLAVGYKDALGGVSRDNVFDLTVRGSPASGAYAMAEDMDRFGRALMAGRLVKPSALARMWTVWAKDPDEGADYGYGAKLEKYNGRRVVSHGGGLPGVTNRFEMYPELGVTVTILGNSDSDPDAIAYKIREWVLQGAKGR